jgi:hypothetical protein
MVDECCMRSHHYGRHGHHAWRKWHKRRYSRPSALPVPVAPPTVIRVYVPITAERIIFIVIQGTQDPNETNPSQKIVEISAGQYMSPTFTPSDTGEMRRIARDNSPLARIKKRAARQASQDIDKIKLLHASGHALIIRWDYLRTRNERYALNDIWKIFPEDESPDEQEKENLVEAYQQTHRDELSEYVRRYPEISNSHVANIRKFAIQDRRDFPPRGKPFHQRDLGVIRALHELEIPWDSALDCLPEIHELADAYDNYYANLREEVDWPNSQEAFPELDY